MKKVFILLTLIAVLLVSAAVGAVIAAPDNLAIKKPIKVMSLDAEISQETDPTPVANGRIIVTTPNFLNKVSYWVKGCKTTQKMNDSAAYECSPGVAKKLITSENAREDRIFKKHDLEADTQIGANIAWTMDPPITGSKVKVAILDTGVDDMHIELSGSISLTKSFLRKITDRDGHGTHISGIVTANGTSEITNNYGYTSPNYATGVAPAADIIVGKVCDTRYCYESAIIAGIQWAVDQGADVLSLSLGGGNYGGHCDSDSLAAEVNLAVDQGVVVVVSSGNDNAGVSSPACASKAIAVGAVDKSDVRPYWSNYGSALDLVAPGVDILSTYSCVAARDCGSYWYAWMSGTSMSAPHVAGTVALILQKNPDYSVGDVKEALYSTAVDLGDTDWDQYYGHGLVDAFAAVNYIIPSEPICGDNIVNQVSEECDGDDLIGQTCEIQGFDYGNLACDKCAFDTTGCKDNEIGCGDGYCAGVNLGEDCRICPQDCPMRMHPRKDLLRCCGNYTCESGENADICPVDCQ